MNCVLCLPHMSYPNCGRAVTAGTSVGMTLGGVTGFLAVQTVGKVWVSCITLAGELNLSGGVSCSLSLNGAQQPEGRGPRGCMSPS